MKEFIKKIVYAMFGNRFIRKGSPGSIYLTYDDGPHPENTENILNLLASYDARATFFMVGRQMEKYPDLVNAVIRSGHTIGYHSYRHDSLKKSSFGEIRDDLIYARDLSKKFGYAIKMYRPPFGDLSVVSFLWLLISGWKIVMWSIDSMDSFQSQEQVKANIKPENISDGEIILLHEDYEGAGDVIEAALQLYRDHGLFCRQL